MNSMDLSKHIRTNCAERLPRTIPLSAIKNNLMAMFVDRLKLQDEVLEQTKQDWIDRCLTFDNEFHKQQNCFLMHKDWNEFERMATKNNWQDLFIEDEKGGNNAW